MVGSDRKFGLLFFIVFLMVGLFPLLAHHEIRIWGLIVSGVFLVAALLVPRGLRPLDVVWIRLGWVLGKIVSPIVLGALFLLAVLPMGLFMRLRGKDLLRLKMDPGAKSYWIERDSDRQKEIEPCRKSDSQAQSKSALMNATS